jgi:phosphoglycerol geranylgeranyltransferase
MAAVYAGLLEAKAKRGGGFLLLLDPDRTGEKVYIDLAEAAEECGVDALLVGTSFMFNVNFHDTVKAIKGATNLPVIIFPGSFAQISPDADAVLFTSLISGRNPNYLIDEQVKGAPLVYRYGLEPIPTGYMLIESGPLTSVQYIAGCLPIPREKNDIACAHALAAQYMGMKLVYLEAGSGAVNPVPIDMIREISSVTDIPVMVGGGLRTVDDCAARVEAGASFIIMGNRFERDPQFTFLKEIAASIHPSESVRV